MFRRLFTRKKSKVNKDQKLASEKLINKFFQRPVNALTIGDKNRMNIHKFGKSTKYQRQVNSGTGRLGPTSSALWKNTYKLTGPAYSLGAQPLYYAPERGYYVTSADVPAANGSVDFSNFYRKKFGKRSRRKSHKTRKTRKNRKSRK